MAQRTGAERFLAPTAKTAGAGLCLALAVAALLLAGCGGSSDDSGGASTASEAAGSAGASSPASPSSKGAKPASDPTSQQGKGAHPSGAPNGGGGQKHGTPPSLPKDESGREHAPTAAEKANSPIADMSLVSPSLPTAEGIAALTSPYTCDGEGTSPALLWSGVPAGSEELVLFAMNAKPVDGRLFFDWALAGLDPHSESLAAGALPKGAVEGTNSFGKRGYEICPPAGGAETYIFALFALPRALSPKPGFDPRALREEILAASGNVGLMSAIYARR